MNTRLVLSICILMFMHVIPIHAQTMEGVISVQQALDYALEHNPELGRLEAELEGVRGQRLSEIGINNPRFSYAREAISNGDGSFGEQRWVIQQSFDSPISTIYGLKQNSARQNVVFNRMEAAKLQLRERVKLAYLDLAYALQLVALKEHAVVLGDSILRSIEMRIAVGDAAELDLMRAKLDQARALTDNEQAIRYKNEVCVALIEILNGPVPSDDCSIETNVSLHVGAIDVLALESPINHPVLDMQQSSLVSAQFGLKQVRWSAFPQFHVNYWPQDFGNGYDFHGFEVGLSIPIFSIFNERGNRKLAESVVQQRIWSQQEERVMLDGSRLKALESFKVSLRALERYNTEVLSQADSTLTLIQRAYEIGEIDLLNLLDTRRMYDGVQVEALQVQRKYIEDLIRLEYFFQQAFVWE